MPADGPLPWDHKNSARPLEQITTGDFVMPAAVPPVCQDLRRGILDPRPDDRLTIDGILTHAWLFRVGNVFPVAKAGAAFGEEPMLKLCRGGSPASNLRGEKSEV
jgi:hypothetical protein